jgi:hypothetical protein
MVASSKQQAALAGDLMHASLSLPASLPLRRGFLRSGAFVQGTAFVLTGVREIGEVRIFTRAFYTARDDY